MKIIKIKILKMSGTRNNRIFLTKTGDQDDCRNFKAEKGNCAAKAGINQIKTGFLKTKSLNT